MRCVCQNRVTMHYIEVQTQGTGISVTCFVREIPRIGESINVNPQPPERLNGMNRVVDIRHPSWPREDGVDKDKPVVTLIVVSIAGQR